MIISRYKFTVKQGQWAKATTYAQLWTKKFSPPRNVRLYVPTRGSPTRKFVLEVEFETMEDWDGHLKKVHNEVDYLDAFRKCQQAANIRHELVLVEGREQGDTVAGWTIGLGLLFYLFALSALAIYTWLAPCWIASFWLCDRIPAFQSIVLAACSAGLGGTVFMVQQFYLHYAYGRENSTQPVRYLERKEIWRYLLLPLSAVVLGPIVLGLLRTGAIAFTGVSAEAAVPHTSVVAVSFVLGFTYHDTLKALRSMSRRLFDARSGNGGEQ